MNCWIPSSLNERTQWQSQPSILLNPTPVQYSLLPQEVRISPLTHGPLKQATVSSRVEIQVRINKNWKYIWQCFLFLFLWSLLFSVESEYMNLRYIFSPELLCHCSSLALPAENSLSNLPQQSLLVVLHVGLRLLQQQLSLLLGEWTINGGIFIHLCCVLLCIWRQQW